MARSITPSRDSSEGMKTSTTLQSRGCDSNRSTPSYKQENPLQGKKSHENLKKILTCRLVIVLKVIVFRLSLVHENASVTHFKSNPSAIL